ncbi:glycosyltransferase [Raoultella sp. T31]|uniref:glycosyltransferase n=1 Tax=Raoultella sp. T31 TaxID=2054594 RepID=UPI000C285FCC|nr:glycosyl transferase family 2 [Raoultella sp. T31]
MNTDNHPKVSIYISTFNRLAKLKRAIDSILQQDYQNIEILVCDDASSDGTREFMEDLARNSGKIFYFRNDSNRGACSTRNLGIFNATGEFITGLDDDDEFSVNRITYFLDHWNDQYSFICANFTNIYPDLTSDNYYASKQKQFNYKDLLFHNEASNQIFTRTNRLKDIGGFDVTVKRLQDWDTWLKLSYKFGDFLRLPESTYIMHHDHAPNEMRVSKNDKITDSLMALMERNINMYTKHESDYMVFLIKNLQNTYSFSECVYWSFAKLNPKFILKYIMK